MVKRYSHTAIITVPAAGSLVSGEWVEGVESTIEIKGRFDPVDTNDVIRTNLQGNEQIVRGEFYTKHKKVDGAVSIEIAELGIKRNIICWWDYQKHSIISV